MVANVATPSRRAPPTPTATPMPSFLDVRCATSGKALRLARARVSGSSSIRGSECCCFSSNMRELFILALRDTNRLVFGGMAIDEHGGFLAKPHHKRVGHAVDDDERALLPVIQQAFPAVFAALEKGGHRGAGGPLEVERAAVVVIAFREDFLVALVLPVIVQLGLG